MLQYKRLLGLGNGRKASGIWIALAVSAIGLGACTNKPVEIDPRVKIAEAAQAPHRRADWVKRDVYRNPIETLSFFDVQPHHTVVEIWPGGGWYTEVLAPLLKDEGKFYAAHFSENAEKGYFRKSLAKYKDKLAANDVYSNVELSVLQPPVLDIAPAGSADRVLTFRNVHNWMKFGTAEATFQSFYDALKPGGLLGVVEHRATAGTSFERMINSGYVTEAAVKKYAKDVGFEFFAASEVNANPDDTKIYPKGVWTLPPSLKMGDENRTQYLQIGESDRMTLLFRKPE